MSARKVAPTPPLKKLPDPVRIAWPDTPPDSGFSLDEGPTDPDLFNERDRVTEPVSIFVPSSEAPGEGALSIEPEELGRVFLRDAVQQMNPDVEAPLGFQPDELDLEAVDWDAKTEPDVARPENGSRENTDLDLSLDVIHDASLFDQPTESEDDEDATREPRIRADDSEHPHVPERAARRRSR